MLCLRIFLLRYGTFGHKPESFFFILFLAMVIDVGSVNYNGNLLFKKCIFFSTLLIEVLSREVNNYLFQGIFTNSSFYFIINVLLEKKFFTFFFRFYSNQNYICWIKKNKVYLIDIYSTVTKKSSVWLNIHHTLLCDIEIIWITYLVPREHFTLDVSILYSMPLCNWKWATPLEMYEHFWLKLHKKNQKRVFIK